MPVTTIVIAVVVLVVIAAVLVFVFRNRRSQQLRRQFGPEYERAVDETGSRQDAERTLGERVERHRKLDIKELDPAARQRYADEWRTVQGHFVDDPKAAVGEADDLVATVMRERGYPTEDFEQQAADVSVDHAEAVPAYRRAHELATARGEAATDDLRQAMVHYRELFVALVGEPAWRPDGAPDERPVTGEVGDEGPAARTTPVEPAFDERPPEAGAETGRQDAEARQEAEARREGGR
jgi:hypothetical protein